MVIHDMEYHSFAGSSRGLTNPEEVFAFRTNGECPADEHDDCDHFVLMWSGNEYSKDHTWITVDDQHLIDLQRIR